MMLRVVMTATMIFKSKTYHKRASFTRFHVIVEDVDKVLGSLRNNDGDGDENVISKYNFSFLLLFRDYSNLFNVKNDGELSNV